MASPRWAMAATAVIAISISIPLLMKRNPEPQVTRSEAPAEAQVQDLARNRVGDSSTQMSEPGLPGTPGRSQQQVAAKAAERETPKAEETSAGSSSDRPVTGSLAGVVAQPPVDAVAERKSGDGEAASKDDAKLKEAAEKPIMAAAGSAPAPQANADQDRAKISKDSALRLPSEDTHSARVETLRPGNIDAGPKTERERDAVAAIRARDGEAPKHRGSVEPESRAGLASGARSRLIGGEGARADRAHSPEKKIGKKTFWLTRGVWTDSDYNSDQKLPVVTVVRDSNVYKELLEKNNKLKDFLRGFGETEKAIIVFKSTVYNLIPQSDNK